MLTECLREAGHPVRFGGAEFADEIVREQDLYRCGKAEPSLEKFIEDLRNGLRLLAT